MFISCVSNIDSFILLTVLNLNCWNYFFTCSVAFDFCWTRFFPASSWPLSICYFTGHIIVTCITVKLCGLNFCTLSSIWVSYVNGSSNCLVQVTCVCTINYFTSYSLCVIRNRIIMIYIGYSMLNLNYSSSIINGDFSWHFTWIICYPTYWNFRSKWKFSSFKVPLNISWTNYIIISIHIVNSLATIFQSKYGCWTEVNIVIWIFLTNLIDCIPTKLNVISSSFS